MTQTSEETYPRRSRRGARALITAACIAVVLTVLWQLLPRGSFPATLDQVGQGRPALVMLREVHVMGGERVIDLMLEVHPEFEERMIFRVTQDGHPDGQAFAREYDVSDGQLVLFNGRGEMIDRMGRPDNADQLRQFIRQALEE